MLEDSIRAELADTPHAPKVGSQRTASYCLFASGKTVIPFRARIPDRDDEVLVLSVLDRICVYTFALDGSGMRLTIRHEHVTPTEPVIWTQGRATHNASGRLLGPTVSLKSPPKPGISTIEAATLAGVDRSTVSLWIKRGKLASQIVGGDHRVKREDVLAIVEQRRLPLGWNDGS
jgi:excisionase family DNA binding protein